MNSLGQLAKDYVEVCAGRIQWRRLICLFLPSSRHRLKRWNGEDFKSFADADGKECAYFRGRGAHCPHPDLWSGCYPRHERKEQSWFVVPAVSCRGCKFHEKASQGHGYACCLWSRERHRNGPSPAELVAGAVNKAAAVISGREEGDE